MFYYVHVTRYEPVNTTGVERWTLHQIAQFIEVAKKSEKDENKGLTYATKYCKIFITKDMKSLALDEENVINF